MLYRCTSWRSVAANFVLMSLKFAAGILGHSRAVLADAVHSLTDLATDLAVIIGNSRGVMRAAGNADEQRRFTRLAERLRGEASLTGEAGRLDV